jgi:Flp pilus assembly protein TadD
MRRAATPFAKRSGGHSRAAEFNRLLALTFYCFAIAPALLEAVIVLNFSPSQAGRARFARAAVLLLALAALGGCRDRGDVTGSIASASQTLPTSDAELRAYAENWGRKYDANPGEKYVSINYAKALRALTRYQQAAAVMQAAAVKAPSDMDVLGAYGKALADAGQLQQAADVLSRS